jgi:hypothetical protein
VGLRNFDDEATITMDWAEVYDGMGVLRCKFGSIDRWPDDFKSVLLPHQGTSLRTLQMKHCHNGFGYTSLDRGEWALQIIIGWSSISPNVVLWAKQSQRTTDPKTNETRSRRAGQCLLK